MRLVPRAEGKGECESEVGVEIEGGLAWRGASLKLMVILGGALCVKKEVELEELPFCNLA